MKNIADLATGFYERVNGEGELGDVLSDDFQFDIMRGFPFGGLQDGLEASKAFFEKCRLTSRLLFWKGFLRIKSSYTLTS